MADIHVSLVAEPIFELFGSEITNSIFTGWIVNIVVLLLLLTLMTNINKIPKVAQGLFEMIYQTLHDLTEDILGNKLTKQIFPLILSLFLYILFGTFIGLLPGVGTLGIVEEVHGKEAEIPLFRAVTADLNATLALTLIVFAVINYYGIKAHHGLGYFKRYFNFSSPVTAFVGILELISETFVRITSFSFRLFGNVFAGEVILTVMLALTASSVFGFLVLPFLLFETFVSLIQAFVFVMLTIVFIAGAVAHDEH